MSENIWFPAIGVMFHKETSRYMVQLTYQGKAMSFTSDLARKFATDLLIWADRVDKLNEEDCDETL